MDPTIIATIISASVATFSVIASIMTARWSIKINAREVDLKAKEFDSTVQKLANDVESVRQSQFSATLKKRIDIYPILWGVILDFTANWEDDKPRDLSWVKNFLKALNDIDKEYGVFFSEAVYGKFHELQYSLYKLKEQLSKSKNKKVEINDLEHIDSIFRGESGLPGLATYLKDDLGSYRNMAIQVRSFVFNTNSSKQDEWKNENDFPRPTTDFSAYSFQEQQDALSELRKKELNASNPVIFQEQLDALYGLRKKRVENSNPVLSRSSSSLVAIGKLMEKQPGFTEIEKKLQNFISSSILKQPKRHIDTTESLIGSGLIDSFSLMDLVLFVEDEFGVHIDDTELDSRNFDTLLELASIIYSRKAERKA